MPVPALLRSLVPHQCLHTTSPYPQDLNHRHNIHNQLYPALRFNKQGTKVLPFTYFSIHSKNSEGQTAYIFKVSGLGFRYGLGIRSVIPMLPMVPNGHNPWWSSYTTDPFPPPTNHLSIQWRLIRSPQNMEEAGHWIMPSTRGAISYDTSMWTQHT